MLTNVRKIQWLCGFQMVKKGCFLYIFMPKKAVKKKAENHRIFSLQSLSF